MLPSGLTKFVTLWGIMPYAPRRIGPFVPTHIYEGDTSDTTKLEQWVAEMISANAAG